MNRVFVFFVLSMALILSINPAAGEVINFDDLANLEVVTTQYAGLTFSSSAGELVVVGNLAHLYGTSLPNIIYGGASSATEPIYIDFSPFVNDLQILAMDIHTNGPALSVVVYEDGSGVPSGFVDISGNGNSTAVHTIDFSAYTNVSRISIVNMTDGFDGINFDDLSFNPVPVELVYFTVE